MTKDHKIVVIHEGTLERTTTGTGKVCATMFEQLRTRGAGKGEKNPIVSEALSLVKNPGFKLVAELKRE
ncbi:hypothetical protein C5S31_00125 [ANME-1 cluster archaeon GoMg2]|nr:hypothetical protein [ANME-1 cluster archaeon GoMg2]